eukprot:COSAG02_NODE_10274_length_1981_cov_1.943146_2_plen_190_part_00
MLLQGVVMALAHAGTNDQQPTCLMTHHASTLHATHDGQVIENVAVEVSTGAAISVHGFKHVTIRNVDIAFGPRAQGIEFGGANDIIIVNASLRLVGAPTAAGPLPSARALAISGSGSANVQINRVRVEGSSSGVYLVQCPAAHLSSVEGHNMRGALLGLLPQVVLPVLCSNKCHLTCTCCCRCCRRCRH